MNLDPYKALNKRLSFLVLEYNRPNETLACIYSIKKYCKVADYEIIVLINGGDISGEYLSRLYEACDKIIISKNNEGSSLGTLRLFTQASSEYVFNIQNDNMLAQDFTEEDYSKCKTFLDEKGGAVSFTIEVKKFIMEFSERAFMCKRDFWLSNHYLCAHGTGPIKVKNGKNSEQAFELWLKFNNQEHFHFDRSIIADTGAYSIIETKSGAIFRKRNDSQQITVINPPPKDSPWDGEENVLNFDKDEWEIVVSGKWKSGWIPKKNAPYIFLHFKPEMDPVE